MDTKNYLVQVADVQGRVTTVAVPVAPVQQEPAFTMLSKLSRDYRKHQRQRSHYIGVLNKMLDLVYSKRPLEAAHHGDARLLLESLSLRTLNILETQCGDDPAKLVRIVETGLNDQDETSKIDREIRIRELAVYGSQCSHLRMFKLILDTLRASHPMFAREDLTELWGDEASSFMTALDFTMDVYDYQTRTVANPRNENSSWQCNWAKTPQAVRSVPRFNTGFWDVLIENPDRIEDITNYLWLSNSEMLEVDTVALRKRLEKPESFISVKSVLSDATLFLGSFKRRGQEKVGH